MGNTESTCTSISFISHQIICFRSMFTGKGRYFCHLVGESVSKPGRLVKVMVVQVVDSDLLWQACGGQGYGVSRL